MTQYQVTLSNEDLHGLFQDDEGLANLMEKVLNQILQAQATEAVGALPYERSETRRGLRNGLRDRILKTRVGSLNLSVPQFRQGSLSTPLWERYQRSEMALLVAMMEMVVNGVSTRKVTKITEELCGTSFSKSTVSELCKSLDPLVGEWNERPLGEYPFLLMDAIVVKVRTGGRVVSRSIMVSTGINPEGYREILGLKIGDSESYQGWSEYLGWLKERGLTGVDYAVSDHHRGLVKAIQEKFQGATWQRCRAHFTKNILDVTPKALKDEVKANLRSIFTAPDPKTARTLLNAALSAYEDKAPKAMETLENGFDDAVAVLTLPENYRRKLRTTNTQERLNREIRRRERVIRIFPNESSAIRLIGAVLMEKDEEWTSGRVYMNMAKYLDWKQEQSSVVTKPEGKIVAAD